jgi:hypothetical protein
VTQPNRPPENSARFTYIGNNFAAITDYAARWDHGEIISTAFAESTVDLVVSRRFAKSAT